MKNYTRINTHGDEVPTSAENLAVMAKRQDMPMPTTKDKERTANSEGVTDEAILSYIET
ncbi:MAG: hypothetical protein HUJ30_02475, partial [Gammaproteobacteria bacterium]|nr:hypothetical protein [Gammaproteobacteria bacterium]